MRSKILKAGALMLACAFAFGTIGAAAAETGGQKSGGGDYAAAQSAKAAEPQKQIFKFESENVRVEILSEALVRIEEKGPKGFEDRNTFHIVNRTDWAGDRVVKTENKGEILLSATKFTVLIKQNAKTLSDVKILSKNNELLWKYSGLPTNKTALPAANESVYAYAIADTPRVVPGENGFAPQDSADAQNKQTNGWDFSNDANDMYIFLPENDQKKLRSDFVSLTGKTEMLPLYAFGSWDSRYYPYSQETALGQIDDYHNRDIPLDVLVVDTDWRSAAGGMGYDINTSLFPDMTEFLADAHAKNVSTVFNDHPEPTRTNGVLNNALNPVEVNYRFSNLVKILKMGLDGWWYDRNWAATVIPPDGFTHEVIGMAAYKDAQKAVYPGKRLFMMSNIDGIKDGTIKNPSNIAAHRYAIQWTGDTKGRQETLVNELYNEIERGEVSALPYVSTDLGAHQTRTLNMTDAEYLRWMQMGSLSPIFRPHVMINDVGRMPWVRSEEVTNIFRDYVNMRYRLLPVFYQLSNENYRTGLPITRSMTFDYPDYKGADRKDQYMLGEDIMAAPVTEETVGAAVLKEWLTTGGKPGVKAEYYNNATLSGTPVITRTEDKIDNDWATGAPDSALGKDNFSIRYSAQITPDRDVQLSVIADDGFKLYVDGSCVLDRWVEQESVETYSSLTLKSGESHEVVLEYFEREGDAACGLKYVEANKQSKLRTVWIPEGEWLNVSSGESFYGPDTVEISCNLKQTPVFVKKGSVVPLADEMLTTKEKDWSHLTLDYYPSTRQSDETQIYEDDGESNDYMQGKCRNTTLKTGFENGMATLSIGAAEGSFDGEKAFSERSYTVRVHTPSGFGELKKAFDEKTPLSFKKVEKNKSAMPFLANGGSNDGDVYEITLKTDISSEKKLSFEFDSAVETSPPQKDYEILITEKQVIPTDSEIVRNVEISSQLPANVNLTSEGEDDWLFASNGKEPIKKDVGRSKISVTLPLAKETLIDYCTKFSATDAKNGENFTNSVNGSYGMNIGDGFDFSVKSDAQAQRMTLYIGAWNGTGKLEIFDETDNSLVNSQTFTAGGASIYRKVTIDFASKQAAKLHIKYKLTGKTDGNGNVTCAAATLKTLGAESFDFDLTRVRNTIEKVPVPARVSKGDYGEISAAKQAFETLSAQDKLKLSAEIKKLDECTAAYNKLFGLSENNVPAGFKFSSPVTLTLRAPGDADMYFTADGSDPTAPGAENVYTIKAGGFKTVKLSASTKIKAAAFTGLGYGEVREASYSFAPVTPPSLKSVEIKGTKKSCVLGAKFKLSARFVPENAVGKTAAWSSSDKRVLKVDSHGNLVAVGVGRATITLKSGKLSKSTSIIVNPKAPSSLKLKRAGRKLTVRFSKGKGAKYTKLFLKGKKGGFKAVKTTKGKTFKKQLKKGRYHLKLKGYAVYKGRKYYSGFTKSKTVVIK